LVIGDREMTEERNVSDEDDNFITDEELDAIIEEAIQRSLSSASPAWRESAFRALIGVARHQEVFTADDVWLALGPFDESICPTPSALGGIFRSVAKMGFIERVGFGGCSRLRKRPGADKSRHHRQLSVWESRMFNLSEDQCL
jgi:hypothetical protein